MDRKDKVLIIDNSKKFTGAFKSILAFSQALQLEYNFVWCIPTGSEVTVLIKKAEFEYHEIPFVEISKSIKTLLYPYFLLKNSLKIRRIINKRNISIIHVNDLYNLSGVVLKLLDNRISIIYHVRLLPSSYIGSMFHVYKNIIRRFADRIITVSAEVNKYFPRYGILISDWLPCDQIPNNPKLERPKNRKLHVLYIGAIMPGKGQMEAMKIVKMLKNENLDFRLDFVGNFSPEDLFYLSILEEIKKNGLEEFIFFHGHIENPDEFYKSTDLVLNLSFSESFSMVCLEASAHGTPVISTNCGGPRDLIVHGKTGYLVEIGDYSATKKYLVKLSKDRKLIEKLGEEAMSFVRLNYNGEKQTELLKEVYLSLR